METKEVLVGDRKYKIRRWTVGEMTEFMDRAAKLPQDDRRGQMKLMMEMVAKAVIEPELTVEQIEQMEFAEYSKLVKEINEYNEFSFLQTI